ncbi:hypothetical protein M885DRAFT_547890 [Pelagophyceae sp. CCMP2097]|nr:hypothetical protein M885DRAFT_547890 [Pelagophyceae sp. CCMP2097]
MNLPPSKADDSLRRRESESEPLSRWHAVSRLPPGAYVCNSMQRTVSPRASTPQSWEADARILCSSAEHGSEQCSCRKPSRCRFRQTCSGVKATSWAVPSSAAQRRPAQGPPHCCERSQRCAAAQGRRRLARLDPAPARRRGRPRRRGTRPPPARQRSTRRSTPRHAPRSCAPTASPRS